MTAQQYRIVVCRVNDGEKDRPYDHVTLAADRIAFERDGGLWVHWDGGSRSFSPDLWNVVEIIRLQSLPHIEQEAPVAQEHRDTQRLRH